MTLSAGERFAMKKRIMDILDGMPTRDVKLAIEEFNLPRPNTWSNHEDLVERAILGADGASIEQLYEALQREVGRQDPPIADLLEDEDNTPFSETEQDRIAEVLDEVKRQATEAYDLPEQELDALNAKLAYLIEAAKYSRRKEWLIVAVTVISQPIVNGVLTPTIVHKVLDMIAAGLGPLFGHPMPLLGP